MVGGRRPTETTAVLMLTDQTLFVFVVYGKLNQKNIFCFSALSARLVLSKHPEMCGKKRRSWIASYNRTAKKVYSYILKMLSLDNREQILLKIATVDIIQHYHHLARNWVPMK